MSYWILWVLQKNLYRLLIKKYYQIKSNNKNRKYKEHFHKNKNIYKSNCKLSKLITIQSMKEKIKAVVHLPTYPLHVDHPPITFYWTVDHLPILFYWTVDHLPITFYWTVDHLPITIYWTVDHLPITIYWTVDHLPITICWTVDHLPINTSLIDYYLGDMFWLTKDKSIEASMEGW